MVIIMVEIRTTKGRSSALALQCPVCIIRTTRSSAGSNGERIVHGSNSDLDDAAEAP